MAWATDSFRKPVSAVSFTVGSGIACVLTLRNEGKYGDACRGRKGSSARGSGRRRLGKQRGDAGNRVLPDSQRSRFDGAHGGGSLAHPAQRTGDSSNRNRPE